MAGLLKCILMLEHQQLVPNIHFTQGEGNSDIKFEQYKLSVQTEIENFENPEELMMISSFGFGGANGCAIIQGYKQSSEQAQTSSSLPQLFLVSASTPHALEARIQELKSSSKTFNSPAAISHTLYNRTLHRLVTFAISEQLDENTTFVPTRKCVDQPLACIWVFAGQGKSFSNGLTIFTLFFKVHNIQKWAKSSIRMLKVFAVQLMHLIQFILNVLVIVSFMI
jgi:acyl transferase domain-containing protein